MRNSDLILGPLVAVAVLAGFAGRGYPATAIAAIMGGNFLRVARQVWNPAADGSQPDKPRFARSRPPSA